MTINEFLDTLNDEHPPPRITREQEALWMDATGDWDHAHRIVQSLDSRAAAWVHAYLHRKEGDIGNAAHWYRRAGRSMSSLSFEAEWREIATALLEG